MMNTKRDQLKFVQMDTRDILQWKDSIMKWYMLTKQIDIYWECQEKIIPI
jgi:hypothetical protein